MVNLKVLLTNVGNKVILLEKDGELYDAAGLFFELDSLDLRSIENAKILYQEEVDYSDTSEEDKDRLVGRVLELESRYGVIAFNNNYKTLKHWIVMNGVSRVTNF